MISVCMATYNGERYLKEQVDSILVQLSLEDELIVSDDGSTDETLNILQNYKDIRIRILNNTKYRGVVGNFENALKSAKGDYIFLADQDDVWLPHKIEKCVNALQSYDSVVTNCFVTDQNLRITNDSYFEIFSSGRGFFKNIYRSSYLGCCIAFKRELLVFLLPFPKSLLLYHDWWVGFLIECRASVLFIDIPCMYFRRHESNVTSTTQKSHLSLFQKIYYRLQLLWLGSIRLLHIKNDI